MGLTLQRRAGDRLVFQFVYANGKVDGTMHVRFFGELGIVGDSPHYVCAASITEPGNLIDIAAIESFELSTTPIAFIADDQGFGIEHGFGCAEVHIEPARDGWFKLHIEANDWLKVWRYEAWLRR